MNGPIGIISAIGISIVVGWGYLLGITFAVTNIPYLLNSNNDAGGYAIAQVFYQAFKSRYGSGVGGIICLGVVAVAIFFCGMSSVTSNSRYCCLFSIAKCVANDLNSFSFLLFALFFVCQCYLSPLVQDKF